MELQKIYAEVIAWYKELSMVGHIAEILHWDERVNLPKKGVELRSEENAFLEGLIHRRFTEPSMVEKVRALADRIDELDKDARPNVREIKRGVDRATKVPTKLVEAISRHISLSSAAWEEARRNDDYAHFAPFLEKTVDLRREEAAALGFADHPYDAMLDLFEPYADERSVRSLLDDLRRRLVPFYHKILGGHRHDASEIAGKPYPIDKQRAFGLHVIEKLGFDFEGGRQDVSAHPFTIGSKRDVRITTRFSEADIGQSLFGMIHEAGHALYEQGLPDEQLDTPLGESVSLSVHESQSRFWENIVGRSLPFWRHFYPPLQAAFPGPLADVSPDAFYRAVNAVTPSLIRTEADEVTYNLHIILRFEIERALVAGEVAVADLPDLWKAKMKEYLDVEVPNNSGGVLQDVHWSEGMIGYFPTYTMGNLYSAQLFEAMRRDLGGFEELLEAGEFAPILEWLREKVHRHGQRYRADDLIERATGTKPSAVPFMNYLEGKYGELYGL